MDISAWSMDMVSSLDCFHPSEKSHALTATALWNSLLTPPQKRELAITAELTPIYPDADAIFYPGMRVEEGDEHEQQEQHLRFRGSVLPAGGVAEA